MKCKMCNMNTKCSCTGGGCKNCNSTNAQISTMNALLDFWLDKAVLHEKLSLVHSYTNRVDNYTLYEYITWVKTQEELDEAIEAFKATKSTYISSYQKEVASFKESVNPDEMCVYDGDGPWARCKFCNSVRKYTKWQKCLMYKNNLNDNKEEDGSK